MSKLAKLWEEKRWGARMRLLWIDDRLADDYSINRADLADGFGISIPQASHDLREYRALGGQLEYDRNRKVYHSGPFFFRLFPASRVRKLFWNEALLRVPPNF